MMASSSLLLIVFTILASLCTVQGKGCSPNPCGTNGMCRESVAGFLVCTCPAGYSGDPFIYCHRAECLDHTECRNDMACRAGSCVNPCVGTCGVNSNCDVIRHVAVCNCPARYSGDPFTYCHRMECLDNIECSGDMACQAGNCVNPCVGTCGVNANCQVIRHVPVCICPVGYTGNPFSHCRPAFSERGV